MVTCPPGGGSQDGACMTQYFVLAASAIAKDSLAHSNGSDAVHFSIIAGVIASANSLAASDTSSPTALIRRQLSHAPCILPEHSPLTVMLLPPRSSSKDTCNGWWMSPIQWPRNFRAINLSLRRSDDDDRFCVSLR